MGKRLKKSPTSGASEKKLKNTLLFWSIGIPFLLVLTIFLWQHRAGLAYLIIKWERTESIESSDQTKYDIRNLELMHRHKDKIFGIDISQYQGAIAWDKVLTINNEFPIDFIFIRASMGE